jgi:hypothetical protein
VVLDDEVEVGEELSPAGVSLGEEAFLGEVGEVAVVGEDGSGVLTAKEVVTPVLEGGDYSEEFLVVDGVVDFGGE